MAGGWQVGEWSNYSEWQLDDKFGDGSGTDRSDIKSGVSAHGTARLR